MRAPRELSPKRTVLAGLADGRGRFTDGPDRWPGTRRRRSASRSGGADHAGGGRPGGAGGRRRGAVGIAQVGPRKRARGTAGPGGPANPRGTANPSGTAGHRGITGAANCRHGATSARIRATVRRACTAARGARAVRASFHAEVGATERRARPAAEPRVRIADATHCGRSAVDEHRQAGAAERSVISGTQAGHVGDADLRESDRRVEHGSRHGQFGSAERGGHPAADARSAADQCGPGQGGSGDPARGWGEEFD